MAYKVITIGRQYGSGGREIGQKLAQTLSIPFYDKELILLAAKESGMSAEIFESMDEKPTSSLLYSLGGVGGNLMGGLRYTPYQELPLSDKLFIVCTKVIRELYEQGPCVIIGRCADYVLREQRDVFSAFIHAPTPRRMERIMRLYNTPLEKVEHEIQKMDKQRAQYYAYFTGRTWSDMENYHLCLNSAAFGADETADLIAQLVKQK